MTKKTHEGTYREVYEDGEQAGFSKGAQLGRQIFLEEQITRKLKKANPQNRLQMSWKRNWTSFKNI